MEKSRKKSGYHKNHYRRAVRCIETGEVWESRIAAAKAFGVTRVHP